MLMHLENCYLDGQDTSITISILYTASCHPIIMCLIKCTFTKKQLNTAHVALLAIVSQRYPSPHIGTITKVPPAGFSKSSYILMLYLAHKQWLQPVHQLFVSCLRQYSVAREIAEIMHHTCPFILYVYVSLEPRLQISPKTWV